ncbi:MAG TPA: Spy/CpxP family protein refolding chaperone [Xanthobacteraceae bacterium]|nr:Spy/CpxP family protein refolding chaperone [Xanthobacteraceae bacterium]
MPIERIRQTVQPTASQQAALDELKAASAKAGKLLRAACPAAVPATPLARLSAIDDRLEATLEAIDIVRPALANFYSLLSDEQKARFNAIGPRQNEPAPLSQSPDGQRQPVDRTAEAPASPNQPAEICDKEASALPDRTIQRIAEVVRPTGREQEALEHLKDASSKASATLHAACPTEAPATPVARLDAMTKRIEAMLQAVAAIRPALKTFYGELSDEQKLRFNAMAAPQPG